MPGGFAPRFLLEAGFLILLGVGAGFADLRPIVTVALLAGGWILVSLVEALVWRAQGRTVASYVELPPPEPVSEPDGNGGEDEFLPEPDVEPDESVPEPGGYPLRADAGSEPSAEAEEYTRVVGAEEDETPDDSAQ